MNNMKIIKEYVLEQKNFIKKTVEKYQINKKINILQITFYRKLVSYSIDINYNKPFS